jgi:ferredoxin
MEINNYIEDIITVDSSKCIGCNKCVKVCPIKVANKTVLKAGTDDEFVTEVNPEKCINCGECVKACKHGARGYTDHSKQFFKMYEKGERINIIVAPAIKTAFPGNMWKHMLQWFKDNNRNVKIYDVSLGADICTWAYNDFLKHNKGSKIISEPCPAIVNYVEKYQPKLIMKLAPVHSPASCLAVYLKKYHNHESNTPIVLFSPCIAKTSEAIHYNTFNFNITFDSLKKYFEGKGLSFDNLGYSRFEFNADPGILGQLFPRPGGLKDNILALQPNLVVRTAEGPQHVYKRLERYIDVPENRRPDVLDVLNCQYGCNQGTASIEENTIANVESYMDELELEAQSERGWWLLKDRTYKRFDKAFDVKDFRCLYKNKFELIRKPTDNDIESIFKSMLKFTPESRTIDCNSCGYDSCHEMACMIYQGYNIKNNCVYYMKNNIHAQLKNIQDLHSTLEKELAVLIDTSDSLSTTVTNVNSSSERSNKTLKGLISDLSSMSSVVTNFHEYFNDVDVADITSEDIDNVINLFDKLENIFSDSFLSRLQSNIQNDNETIEAIHSLDEKSQTLLNIIAEIKSKFEHAEVNA